MTLVNSVNPFRLDGQKTAAFEVCDDLGRAPDVLAIPVGNAGNISAYWAGFRDYAAAGVIGSTPADVGLPGRRCGADRRSAGGSSGRRRSPPRSASATRPRGSKAIAARDESGGRIEAVTDDEILAAYRDLARLEGMFCEPASAASVAGHAQAGGCRPGRSRTRLVVAVLTGHGLKDPAHGRAAGPRRPRGRTDARCGRRRAGLDIGATWSRTGSPSSTAARVTVEVPASSANLGAGYDCLGVALALANRIEVEVRGWSRGEIELTVEGEGRNELSEDRENRFVRGLEAALVEARGRRCPRGSAGASTMHNQIPLARGLGSSAAATVAGVVAGERAARRRPLDAATQLRLATEIEGHPDNAAAALLGWLRRRRPDSGPDARPSASTPPRDLRAVAVHPGAAAVDADDAQGAARRRCRSRTPWPTSARWRSGSPGWRPAGRTCSGG